MGLASALSTALTGMTAAETTIDVVGNNLANSNTVGFKASEATFATQFLQTQGLGSAPSDNSGGTNPRQIGLGTMVADITPNFHQGTIQLSSSPTDLAIQGDGFFILQGNGNEQVYGRNGVFKMNSSNELVSTTGNRLLGYGINNQFQIDTTSLQALRIPLGTATVAKATTEVVLQGTLTPTGNIADQAEIIQTGILGDDRITRPTAGLTASVNDTGNIGPGRYRYYVTYIKGGIESRPSPIQDPIIIQEGSHNFTISALPADATGWADSYRIYRNPSDDETTFYQVGGDIPVGTPGLPITDNLSDEDLKLGNVLDMDGPRISYDTPLEDVIYRNAAGDYQNVFEHTGTLHFTGSKGERTLTTKDLQITDTSTVQDLITFMEQALGIQKRVENQAYPVPEDSGSNQPPGGSIVDGRIRLTGNNGVENAIGIALSGLQMTTDEATPQQVSINLPFTSEQEAKGQSAVADLVAYDSLGMPLSVRITTVLEERTSSYTAYRWFADCANNDPPPGSAQIAVGTGLIKFDGTGNLLSVTNSTVSIDRYHVPSVKPLQFDWDFSQLSGLASDKATLAVSRQDGSAPGVLSSFIIGEDGRIRGVFNNGITRDLGQIRLARFGNPAGLEQRGENLYASGVNSGLPVEGNPGDQGIGSITAGAVELSNTDIGSNLIDLILASTMYRGNTRVITTTQQMLDELLALRR